MENRKNPGVPSILWMYCRTYLLNALLRRDTAFPNAVHVFCNRIGAKWHSRCRSGTLRLMIRQLDPPPDSALAGHKRVHQNVIECCPYLGYTHVAAAVPVVLHGTFPAYHEVPGSG
jgi:hypothetical protein